MAKLSFDATDVPTASQFDLIPKGTRVRVVIEKTEIKNSKNSTRSNGEPNGYLALELVVIDGPYEGKRFFENLNLFRDDDTAKKIAETSFSQICHATGKLVVEDSDDLLGIPMLATVGIQPEQNGYEARNKLTKYAIDGDASEAEAPPAKSADKQASLKAAPWARK